ncbi:MAG: hypothetical protein WD850_01965 [Candidatus Spechtbacterales bacterium]
MTPESTRRQHQPRKAGGERERRRLAINAEIERIEKERSCRIFWRVQHIGNWRRGEDELISLKSADTNNWRFGTKLVFEKHAPWTGERREHTLYTPWEKSLGVVVVSVVNDAFVILERSFRIPAEKFVLGIPRGVEEGGAYAWDFGDDDRPSKETLQDACRLAAGTAALRRLHRELPRTEKLSARATRVLNEEQVFDDTGIRGSTFWVVRVDLDMPNASLEEVAAFIEPKSTTSEHRENHGMVFTYEGVDALVREGTLQDSHSLSAWLYMHLDA